MSSTGVGGALAREAHTRPFKFRGQAALDLRRRQDDEAQRVLADAVRARQQAETNVDTASSAVDESMQAARKALESPASVTLHQWHRNWIVSKRQELAASRTALAKSRAAERLAQQQAYAARRALRVIERWRDRARRRYEAEQRRVERIELDAIGGLQYAARLQARGGD